MKLDSDEVIVEIPGADGKNSVSGNYPNTEDVHLHDSGLRSRKNVAAVTDIAETNRITTTSQLQIEDDSSSQLKTKSSINEPEISSNSETGNIDRVSVSGSPLIMIENLRAVSPVKPTTPLMASIGKEKDEIVHYPLRYRLKKIKVLVIIEFCLFVCITSVLILSVNVSKLEKKEIWNLKLWKWCGLGLAIFCGRLFSEWLMNIVVFLIEKKFPNNKVMYLVHSAYKSFWVFIWLGLILLTWVLLINRGVSRSSDTDKVLNDITRGIASILRTMVLKFLYSSFYLKRFFDRIQENIFHRYILQNLSGKSLMELSEMIQTKAAADLIFRNVAKPEYNYIEEEDLLRFMNKEEADMVLSLIGGAVERGRINKKSVLNWVVSIYLKNKLLQHSLNDIKEAINILNKFITGLLVVVLIILWVILMGIVSTEVLLFISSQFLLAVFTFGSSAKSTFEAMIFVFVKHPFDVGDRCVIDGIQVVVEEVSILTTVFLRYDKEKMYYPNSILATKCISNFNRSPEMMDTVEFDLDISTSVENISALKAKIKTYIDSKPQLWRPEHSVQDYEEKSERRSNLVLELKNIFQQLGIKYHILPPTTSS
uniref:mechanosensitive ion channel protein 10-like n=1 Tax=Erigeron canadensis TaxID=72917 RepID=UPI001CB8E75F|nr:mechanosensitive ion channel protein 10-like [Erigeron canadensis]